MNRQAEIAILKKAVELIDIYGWVQGSMGSREIGFCMEGALRSAADTYQTNLLGAYRALRDVMENDVVSYNDTPNRLWPECRKKMTEAIEKLHRETAPSNS